MAIPLLGLLATQGARTIATRIAGSAATRRKVANTLEKNFKKAQKESLEKGKIPTNKTLTEGLTKDQKGLLSNLTPKTTCQVLGQPINLLGRTPTASTFGQRIGTAGERIVIPTRKTIPVSDRARQSGRFLPVPVQPGVNPLQQQASRIALARQKEAMERMNRPITQTVDEGTGFLGSLGLLGGATALPLTIPMFFGGEETTMPTTPTAPKSMPETAEEQKVRLAQLLRPTKDATAKEVINAALLRAGLSMFKTPRPGRTRIGEALQAATSISSEQNTYRTGEEALKAGQDALGKDAKISIYQRSDGTFGYQGTSTGVDLGINNFFNSEGSLTEEQIKSYLQKAGGDTQKAIKLALADGYTEEQLGIE